MTLTQKDLDAIRDLIKVTIDEDETIARKFDLTFLPTKNEFYAKMDKVMGELKTIREGQEILTGKVYNDHEPRLSKIEKKLQIQTSV